MSSGVLADVASVCAGNSADGADHAVPVPFPASVVERWLTRDTSNASTDVFIDVLKVCTAIWDLFYAVTLTCQS